ncbi:MAG: nitrilase-related carbon-nitrogen hydrolase, partial [Pseudomonadota bacterium]
GGNAEAEELFNAIESDVLNRGGSMIAAPDARVVAQAGDREEILRAELDLTEIGQGLASLDTDGHYSRPDVFELSVDTRPKDGVNWNS